MNVMEVRDGHKRLNTSQKQVAGARQTPIRIGLVGCGVVGTGVMQVLSQRADTGLLVTHIAVRDLARPRAPFVDTAKLGDDWRVVCEADDVDVVIEVVGGTDVAHDVVKHALECGKSVVTANKALMAAYGEQLRELAAHRGVQLRHEASVLGGIPALHTIETYFRLNHVKSFRGIVNGTCNYILTQMFETGMAFEEALKRAQELGYAEPNPASDVEGLDAFYKLQVLLQAFGADAKGLAGHGDTSGESLMLSRLARPVQGITGIDAHQIAQAKAIGSKIKHVCSAVWNVEAGEIVCTVGPEVLDPRDPLYPIDGVNNALCIEGDIVGAITLVGPGAGALPTASAVLEDVLKIVDYL